MSAKNELKRKLQQKISDASLAGKWMPRKGKTAARLRNALGMSPKSYRKTLVTLSNTVEQQMCAKDWPNIKYKQVPSLASARYQKAFWRNDPIGYGQYVSALVKGETKINAGAVYPYDITKSLHYGDSTVANEQWKALPDYLEGSKENILPMVDVSGSMTCRVGGSASVSCMDVAISLGLYLSERSRGIYKDAFLTFSESPEMQTVSGTLKQRYEQMSGSRWGLNTDLQKAFVSVLDAAVRHKVPAEQMPTMLLILSDMEFDRCTSGTANTTAFKMIEDRYTVAGYTMPKVVFWNLNGRPGNMPVTKHQSGTALVSGFSPALMTSLLSGSDDFSPESIMLKTVTVSRYDY